MSEAPAIESLSGLLKPQLTDIGHGHYVFGNSAEIAKYKEIREAGVPLKSITIRDPNAPEEPKAVTAQDEMPAGSNYILDTPLHDTGSKWYVFLSFLLPLLGLIGAVVFRKFNHIRNYKACKKGALAGFAVIGSIIALFGLALLLAVL